MANKYHAKEAAVKKAYERVKTGAEWTGMSAGAKKGATLGKAYRPPTRVIKGTGKLMRKSTLKRAAKIGKAMAKRPVAKKTLGKAVKGAAKGLGRAVGGSLAVAAAAEGGWAAGKAIRQKMVGSKYDKIVKQEKQIQRNINRANRIKYADRIKRAKKRGKK